jgi:hypothetical protein
MKTIIDKLSERCIEVRGPLLTPCWLWVGANDGKPKHSYGRITIGGKDRPAHVVCYEVSKGEVPIGMFVCHHCDNGLCINPEHLFLGAAQDNTDDMVTKLRHGFRERHSRAKLKENDLVIIKQLLASAVPHSKIAQRYDVSKSTISMISNGTNWR